MVMPCASSIGWLCNRRNGVKKEVLKRQVIWYSFIILPIIAMLLFTYVPMVKAIQYSVSDVSTLGGVEKFVGIRNYRNLLQFTEFPKSVFNTFALAFMGLLTIPLGFILADMINSLGPGKLQGFFRVCFYLPHIIASVTVVLILQVVLKASDGLLNSFLSLFTTEEVTIGWLSDVKYAKFGASIIYIWSNLGYNILINLASLQAIPSELYEAASVDGAGSLKKLTYITLPHMRACFVFLFLTGMINGLARFSDLYILGGNNSAGRPDGTLQTMMMFVYRYGFERLDFGVSSAAAIMLFIISFSFSMVSARISGFFNDRN